MRTDLRLALGPLLVVAVYCVFLGGSILAAVRRSHPSGVAWALPLGFLMGAATCLLMSLDPSASRSRLERNATISMLGLAVAALLGTGLLRLTPGDADEVAYLPILVATFALWLLLPYVVAAPWAKASQDSVVPSSDPPAALRTGDRSRAPAYAAGHVATPRPTDAGRARAGIVTMPSGRARARLLIVVAAHAAFLGYSLAIGLRDPRPEGIAWGTSFAFLAAAVLYVLAPPWWEDPSRKWGDAGATIFSVYLIMFLVLGLLLLRLTPSKADDSTYGLGLLSCYILCAAIFGLAPRAGPEAAATMPNHADTQPAVVAAEPERKRTDARDS